MKFLKNIFFLLVVCAGLQQSCNAMEEWQQQDVSAKKQQVRDLIVATNENCATNNDDAFMGLRHLFGRIKCRGFQNWNLGFEGVLRELRRIGFDFKLYEQDLIFDDGETTFTIFAKTCCSHSCLHCMRRLDSVLRILECDDMMPAASLRRRRFDRFVRIDAVNFLGKRNLEGETFFSIIKQRNLMSLLGYLIYRMYCNKSTKLLLPLQDRVLFQKDSLLLTNLLSNEVFNSFLELVRRDAIRIREPYKKVDFLYHTFVEAVIDFSLDNSLIFGDNGRNLISFLKCALSESNRVFDIAHKNRIINDRRYEEFFLIMREIMKRYLSEENIVDLERTNSCGMIYCLCSSLIIADNQAKSRALLKGIIRDDRVYDNCLDGLTHFIEDNSHIIIDYYNEPRNFSVSYEDLRHLENERNVFRSALNKVVTAIPEQSVKQNLFNMLPENRSGQHANKPHFCDMEIVTSSEYEN